MLGLAFRCWYPQNLLNIVYVILTTLKVTWYTSALQIRCEIQKNPECIADILKPKNIAEANVHPKGISGLKLWSVIKDFLF